MYRCPCQGYILLVTYFVVSLIYFFEGRFLSFGCSPFFDLVWTSCTASLSQPRYREFPRPVAEHFCASRGGGGGGGFKGVTFQHLRLQRPEAAALAASAKHASVGAALAGCALDSIVSVLSHASLTRP